MLPGSRFAEKLRHKYYNDHAVDPDTNQERVVARPKIEVAFRKNSSIKDPETNPEIRVYGLVDSGADMTIIPLSFAQLLGYNNWNSQEIENSSGAEGGLIPYFIRNADITIGDIKIRIQIACSLLDNVPFLLGRKDIFDKFQVCFNDKEKKIKFTEL